MLDSLSLGEELISSLFNRGLSKLIVHVKSINQRELAVSGSHWEGENKTFWDAILRSVGEDTH